jgi:hypothetical protein
MRQVVAVRSLDASEGEMEIARVVQTRREKRRKMVVVPRPLRAGLVSRQTSRG